jgi:hypothetical protein
MTPRKTKKANYGLFESVWHVEFPWISARGEIGPRTSLQAHHALQERHIRAQAFVVGIVPLHDAEGVNPEVLDVETPRHCHRVLEILWKVAKFNLVYKLFAGFLIVI